MAQDANSTLPNWLQSKFHALPVGLFATVASSNLTPQNNDLEISTAAWITKKVDPAGIGLPEYHRYMAITEPEAFKGPGTILRQGPGSGSRFSIFLVRRKKNPDLAGCFLFGSSRSGQSQDAASSSSSNPGAWAGTLLLQRVYSLIRVKASQWYRCLYSALLQLLYKPVSLPVHLLSAGLLPEIRMATDRVRSLPLDR
jgi:hypothetical protein